MTRRTVQRTEIAPGCFLVSTPGPSSGRQFNRTQLRNAIKVKVNVVGAGQSKLKPGSHGKMKKKPKTATRLARAE
jgi:hypothetical protein